MQDALQAAVSRMNNGTNGSPEPKPSFLETVGPFLPLIPKLLQNNGAGEKMLERLDTLQKNDLTALRDQVQLLRRQCHRMLKAQEQLLERVHEIQRQQVAAAGAVLDLAQQMARVTFVDGSEHEADTDPEIEIDEDDDEADLEAPPVDYRTDGRVRRHGSGRRQRET